MDEFSGKNLGYVRYGEVVVRPPGAALADQVFGYFVDRYSAGESVEIHHGDEADVPGVQELQGIEDRRIGRKGSVVPPGHVGHGGNKVLVQGRGIHAGPGESGPGLVV
jgi:hypothetical protein